VRLKEQPSPINSPRKWRLDWPDELKKKHPPRQGMLLQGKYFAAFTCGDGAA